MLTAGVAPRKGVSVRWSEHEPVAVTFLSKNGRFCEWQNPLFFATGIINVDGADDHEDVRPHVCAEHERRSAHLVRDEIFRRGKVTLDG